MKQVAFLGALWMCCHIANAQEGEIIEAQRRLAIVSAGSEHGIHRSDTLWVSEASDKEDHLIAKATVIALRKRYAAIEAFQFFGAYGLAVGQLVYRVKDLPAPLTAPRKKISRPTQEPELTLADLYRQRPRIFIFAGGAVPLGDMADGFATSSSGGIGARLPVFPGVQITLSGRYIALRTTRSAQKNLDTLAPEISNSMWVISTGFRPLSRIVIFEIGVALYQTHTTTKSSSAESDFTFNDFGAAASIGKYFKLSDRTSWMVLATFHYYFSDEGASQFLTFDLQFAF